MTDQPLPDVAKGVLLQRIGAARAVGALRRIAAVPRPAVAWLMSSPWPMPASIGLHLALVVVIALRVQGAGSGSPPQIEPPSIEIDLVNQPNQQRGVPTGTDAGEAATAAASAPPPSDAAMEAVPGVAVALPAAPAQAAVADAPALPDQSVPPPPPASPPERPAVPMPTLGALGVPMPVRYVAATGGAESRPPSEQQSANTQAADRGNADRDQMAMLVQGTNVVPPQPDAQHHNRPPAYPPDAARKRITGTVELVVRVTPRGTAGTIRISRSSGVPSLDRSAADAIRAWHFTPALRDGEAVAFDYPISIRFTLGNG